MRRFHSILSACLLSAAGGCAVLHDSPGPEVTVCGPIKEPMVFALWSRLAGKPDPNRADLVPNAEAITYRTSDGRSLRGYRLNSTAPDGEVVGRMLVAQGNAMLSDQLLSSLATFSQAGIEAYIFDYRGYGNSEGRRRLQAMVSDYREMAEEFTAAPGGKRLLYGISFGGVVVANVIGAGGEYDRAVIDSTPSRVSPLGCPEQYDPVENLPQDASKIMLVAGEQDTVVTVQDSEELVTRGRALGAHAQVRPDYAHPFMDRDGETHRSRLDLIRSFLLESDPASSAATSADLAGGDFSPPAALGGHDAIGGAQTVTP